MSESRRGRPPGTTHRELELIALRLFTQYGFDETTVEQIAAEAGITKRTFFRYFATKTDVLWHSFDDEIETIRAGFAAIGEDVPMMDAITQVVIAANRYRPEDIPELRARMNLIATVPALLQSAALHYDDWERAISEFAARRLNQPADSLYPLAIGRATLAAARAAYDSWVTRADAELTVYLAAALEALTSGFSQTAPPDATPAGSRSPRRASASTSS